MSKQKSSQIIHLEIDTDESSMKLKNDVVLLLIIFDILLLVMFCHVYLFIPASSLFFLGLPIDPCDAMFCDVFSNMLKFLPTIWNISAMFADLVP